MSIQIRYLGWSAFELTTPKGTRILLDPMLAGSRKAGIPPSPVSTEDLYGVKLVLVTHAADDHIGQAIEIIQHSQATLVCDAATAICAQDAVEIPDHRIYRMASGVQYAFDDVKVKALPAQHLSLGKISQGYVSAQPLSYLLETDEGEKIFFSGDTSIHSDLKLFGELYQPHVAILGVGGVNVHGQSLTELYPNEAAIVAKWLGVQLAIPMHYRFQEGEAFVAELEKLAPGIRGLILDPGESYLFSL